MLVEVTLTMMTTASKIEAPSSQPSAKPSVAIPNTRETTAEAHKILSISSSKFSITSSKIVLGGLIIGWLSPHSYILFSWSLGSVIIPLWIK